VEVQRLLNVAAFFVAETFWQDVIEDIISEVLCICKEEHQDDDTVEAP